MKHLIYLLMTLVGFGCISSVNDKESDDFEATPEYGCPHVNFSLKARVVDEAGAPIKGIKVCTDWIEEYTNQDGEININGSVFTGSQYMATFEDVDGEANGGEFETLVLDITDKIEKVGEGSGNWYDGYFKAELGNVAMRLKGSDTESDNN